MIVVVIVAYLIGSIPFGYLIVRGKVGDDIRRSGSGGTGATNVSRRAGRAAGVFTLVLDALKGVIAVLVARTVFAGVGPYADWLAAAAGIAAIVGHIFPVWLGFRGGKGVATGVGVFIILAPVALLCAGVLFIAIVALTRYVSLGSIIAALAIPLFVWLQAVFVEPVADLRPLLTAAITGALLILFAHRGNIGRLARGTESQI
ncbi:MAG TPA: glycerol-3-phosphate 1-O-acyltransferase PlsY, partial [Pyrinomonadaceae bacterium]|nr:glycerol-3-phosphate 1-O-acyltransferase PlsY [Pyrinomonadaceae bacterium]